MNDELRRYHDIHNQLYGDTSERYIGYLLKNSVPTHPELTALICQDRSISYKDLYQQAVRCSLKLQSLGVRTRDRVMIYMQNSIEFYIAYFGILQVGAVVMPVNTFLFGTALQEIIDDAQPCLIIASSELVTYIPKESGIPILEHVQLWSDKTSDTTSFDITPLQEEEMAVLLYTSGTTGKAKGVMLSSKNIMTNIAQGIARLGFRTSERVLAILPLFHSFAQATAVWAAFYMRATVIVVPRIDRKLLLQGLDKNPTIFVGVPALYGLLCLLRTAPLDSISLFVCGGDAVPDKIRIYFSLLYRRIICNGYGLTETSPLIAFEYADEMLPTNCVGRPVVGMEIEIRNEQNNVLLPGTIGILWVKGDNVMMGYFGDDVATRAVLQNGWLNTGDLAYVDAKGRIVITGRFKDLIIHKGFNIYPQEIENILLLHPQVMRAAVIGKQDDQAGEIPIAFVQLKEEIVDIQQILYSWCAQRLAAYKIPRTFFCSTEELPMTATGKINKKMLKKQL